MLDQIFVNEKLSEPAEQILEIKPLIGRGSGMNNETLALDNLLLFHNRFCRA
jgi:hypothetical protein